MNESERETKLNKKKDKFNEMKREVYYMREKLSSFGKNKHSPAYKVALSALDVLSNQIEQDHNRYVKRIRIAQASQEVGFIQKALNREKAKNLKLEQKIEEAKTSSGLFVDLVRKKLKI